MWDVILWWGMHTAQAMARVPLQREQGEDILLGEEQ